MTEENESPKPIRVMLAISGRIVDFDNMTESEQVEFAYGGALTEDGEDIIWHGNPRAMFKPRTD